MNTPLTKSLDEYISERSAEEPGFRKDVKNEADKLRIQDMLHLAREAAGLTQKQVAERMRVNRSFVSRLENHPQDMRISTFQRYAQAVGLRAELVLHAMA